jgi:hypothetical protein
VVNSRKSVNFTSANGDRLRVNSGMVFTNSVTAIVFIKPGTQNFPYADILDQDHAMDGYNGWVIQRNNDASQWLVWLANEANTTWLNTNAVSYADNTPQIVTLRKGSSTLTLSSNGTSSGDVAISDQQIRQAGYLGLNIGSWRAGNELFSSSRHYNGEICEIVVYNRALSLTELKQVHTYLGQKWGILNTDRSIIDLSGFNDNGLLGNGTTTAMPAFDFYNKGALRFDGADDYLVASIPSIAASSTVAIWIKSSNYDVKIPISINGDSYGSGPNIFFFSGLINWNTGDSADNPFSGSSYPDGNWHYIVVTNDAATNAKLYIDGVLIGTAAYRSTLSTVSDNFWVGRFHGDNNYTINANIAAAQLYNKVLSAAEVLQNYEAQKSKFANTIVQNGLVLNLDAGNPYSYAGSGTTWYDVSGGGYNATIVNAPTFVSDSIKYFTCSSTQNFTISNPISSQPNLSQIWTVSAWVNIDTITGAAARYLISGLNNGVAVEWFDSGTLLYLNGGANDYYTYGSSIEGSGWVYLTFLFRNSDGYRKIYNNLIDITTSGPNNTSTPAGNLATFTIANNMRGKIAQIIMYNRLLTVAEIAQNYNTTKGRFGL